MTSYGDRTKESHKSKHFLIHWWVTADRGSLHYGLRYYLMTFLALGLVKVSGLLNNILKVLPDRHKKVRPRPCG